MAGDNRKKVSIRFNGKEISNPAELPPEMRKLVEEAEGRFAHVLDRPAMPGGVPRSELEFEETSESYEIDGKTYHSLEEMPPELRKEVEEASNEVDGDDEVVQRLEVSTTTTSGHEEVPPELRASGKPMLGRHASGPRRATSTEPAAAATPAAPLPRTTSPRPRPVGPPWSVILLSVLAGALLMYLLLRR